jgi:hypothetical protein
MGLIRQVATVIAFLTALQAFGLMYRFGGVTERAVLARMRWT